MVLGTTTPAAAEPLQVQFDPFSIQFPDGWESTSGSGRRGRFERLAEAALQHWIRTPPPVLVSLRDFDVALGPDGETVAIVASLILAGDASSFVSDLRSRSEPGDWPSIDGAAVRRIQRLNRTALVDRPATRFHVVLEDGRRVGGVVFSLPDRADELGIFVLTKGTATAAAELDDGVLDQIDITLGRSQVRPTPAADADSLRYRLREALWDRGNASDASLLVGRAGLMAVLFCLFFAVQLKLVLVGMRKWRETHSPETASEAGPTELLIMPVAVASIFETALIVQWLMHG